MTPRYRPPNPGFVEQTAILRDVQLPEVRGVEGGQAKASFTPFPWLVILTQDCDLQFDRLARAGTPLKEGGAPVKKDKMLRSILLCPAFSQDHVTAGIYIEGASAVKGTRKVMVLENRHERFHLLPSEEPLMHEPLVLDFKLTVAAHPDYLQQWLKANPAGVVAVLNPPFRDRLMQRFVNYFGRRRRGCSDTEKRGLYS